jgi:hypothetical protein
LLVNGDAGGKNHITTNCSPPARAPITTGEAVDDQLDLLRLAADNADRKNNRTGQSPAARILVRILLSGLLSRSTIGPALPSD